MPPANLGQVEWEILQYVAGHHPATVREVADHMASHKGHARTTVLTVMTRLRTKGFLARRKVGGVYRYSPKKSVSELTHEVVQGFVDKMLNGTLTPFLAYLSRSSGLTDEQIAELKKLVQDLESQRREGRK